MRCTKLALVLLATFLIGSSVAVAQWSPDDPENISRLNVSGGFNYARANAPPADCGCFSLIGGYFSAGYHIKDWLSVEAEVTGGHANNISALGQDLTLLTFAGGVKYQYNGHRFVPFAKALVGGAHGSDSYFPTATGSSPTANSLALQGGGGVDFLLTDHLAIRVADVEYLRTTLPNGTTKEQNQLMASVGIVYRFNRMGSDREPNPAPEAPSEDQGDIQFSCTSNVNSIDPGDTLEVTGKSLTEPSNLVVTYSWTSSVGTVIGTGDRVSLDTQGVAPGAYHVLGTASATGKRLLTAECDIPFRIKTPTEAVRSPTPAPANEGSIDPAKNKEFHENVPDALFDFDSYAIRPDAQLAINHAADYLHNHPEIGVLIGGFADDRGSAEYNLVLGEERAQAARQALIAAGVQPARLQIISYGKEVQVCTAENEECRQQNRRAAFSMHP
jgi:outer membrane protein OmpA-like peptidoglycan-associated protein/opacity protein-like surface antigen